MTGCMQCDDANALASPSKCSSKQCQTVVLKLAALPDQVKRDELKKCLRASRLRSDIAAKMADQISDLGVAEVVLPNVNDLDGVLRELDSLGISSKMVHRAQAEPAQSL